MIVSLPLPPHKHIQTEAGGLVSFESVLHSKCSPRAERPTQADSCRGLGARRQVRPPLQWQCMLLYFCKNIVQCNCKLLYKQHVLETQRFLCMTQHVPVIKHLTPFSAVTSTAGSTCVIARYYSRIGALVAVFLKGSTLPCNFTLHILCCSPLQLLHVLSAQRWGVGRKQCGAWQQVLHTGTEEALH